MKKNQKDETNWYIWLINSSKFEYVKRYLKECVEEVKEILYPTFTKEYKTQKGKIKKKKVPLYSSYIFLQYKYSPEITYKIKDCPFIHRYLGRCQGTDLVDVKKMLKVEEYNKDKNIEVGDIVSVNAGPLKGFKCEVSIVSGDKLYTQVDIFGRNVRTEVLIEDVDIVSKGRDVTNNG